MRQAFFLLLTLLLLRLFMPEVGHRLEEALLALLDLAQRVFAAAQLPS
jgi:hypothetical protein